MRGGCMRWTGKSTRMSRGHQLPPVTPEATQISSGAPRPVPHATPTGAGPAQPPRLRSRRLARQARTITKAAIVAPMASPDHQGPDHSIEKRSSIASASLAPPRKSLHTGIRALAGLPFMPRDGALAGRRPLRKPSVRVLPRPQFQRGRTFSGGQPAHPPHPHPGSQRRERPAARRQTAPQEAGPKGTLESTRRAGKQITSGIH